MEEIIHRWEKSDPLKKVKLLKMSKGYNWEITYENIDNKVLLDEVNELDKELRKAYNEGVE